MKITFLKTFLTILIVIFTYSISYSECVRHVDSRVYSKYFNPSEWSGFSITTWWDGPDYHITCLLSKISTASCQSCSGIPNGNGGGNGGDPTDETAANALFESADIACYEGNFNTTIYATYQVLGEENLRHYQIVVSWSGLEEDSVIQTFSRIDKVNFHFF